MATTKIKTVKARLDKIINYITNPDKTANGTLVGSFNCRANIAYTQMMNTKSGYGKTDGRQGYHLIQSFAPGEITPSKAFELAQEYARRYLSDKYEVIFSIHQDKEHIHAHFVWNSVSFADGRKYHADKREYPEQIRRISDEICRANNISVIENPERKGKSYAERAAEKTGQPTIRSQIRNDIDELISMSYNYKHFLENLRKRGYAIKHGQNVKHMAIRPPYSTRFFRLSSMGDEYTEQGIQGRITGMRRGEVQMILPLKYRHIERPKSRSFRALYTYYLLLLGKIGPRELPPKIRQPLREDVIKLRRLVTQFEFLDRNMIDTYSQLDRYEQNLDSLIDAMTDRRSELYKSKRQGENCGAEIEGLTAKLRELRKEKRLIVGIRAEEPDLYEKLIKVTEVREKQHQNAPHIKNRAR